MVDVNQFPSKNCEKKSKWVNYTFVILHPLVLVLDIFPGMDSEANYCLNILSLAQ
jgi:hypothetical protein